MSNKISTHISYDEATVTGTGIANVPDKYQLANMKVVAEKVFEPLRKGLGNNPIKINSFFRDYEVNVAIGGSKSSQHCRGMAIDMDGIKSTNAELFFYILDNLDYDQLIWERGDDKEPNWVHVSYNSLNPAKNRKQTLVLRGGKYLVYSKELCKRPKAKKVSSNETKTTKGSTATKEKKSAGRPKKK